MISLWLLHACSYLLDGWTFLLLLLNYDSKLIQEYLGLGPQYRIVVSSNFSKSLFTHRSQNALNRAEQSKALVTEAENLQDDTIKHLEDSSEAYLQANLKIIEALNESSISLDILRDAALTGINQKVKLLTN